MSNEDKILEKLDRIERGLYGDSTNQQSGLIQRVTDLENLATKLTNAKWYVLGAVGIMTAVWGIGFALFEVWKTFKGGG